MHITEGDFTSIMYPILNHYAAICSIPNLVVAPEALNNNVFNRRCRCDGLISAIDVTSPLPDFGKRHNHIVYEAKVHAGDGWPTLMDKQMWDQADSAKNDRGRIWAIAQRGFQVCVFKFYVRRLDNYGSYDNFQPLNLRNFTENDLIFMDTDPVVEFVNNVRVIKVIKWKINDTSHYVYIDEMLNHIFNNNV